MALVLVLAAGTGGGRAQADELTVTPVTSFVEALPRQSVTLVFRLGNTTGAEQSVLPVVELPDGWQLLVPVDPVTLPPGGEHVLLLAVLVPQDAPAGDYPVRVDLQGSIPPVHLEGRATVRIRPTRGLEATLVRAPAYTLGDPYRLVFSVRNTGNTPQQVTFRIHDNLGFRTVTAPAEARIRPGELVTVDVSVQVPQSLTKAATHRVQLIAEGDGPSVPRAQASAAVEIIPRSVSGDAAYHTFPLRIAVDREMTATGGVTGWEISGTGALAESDPGRLTLQLGDEGGRAAYTRPNLYLSAGDQRFVLSPLTEFGERLATGAEMRATMGPLVLTSYAHRDGTGRERVGAQAALDLGGAGALSLQFLDRSEAPGDLWSLQAQVSPAERWDFQVEYGLQATASLASSPDALRLTSRFSGGALVTHATWEQVGAGYREATRASRRLQLYTSVPFSDAMRLGLRFDDLMEYEGVPWDGWARNVRNTGLNLSGGWEGTGWWLQYARSDDVEPGQRDRSEGSLRFVLNLPIDGKRFLFQDAGLRQVIDRVGGTESLRAAYRLSYHAASPDGGIDPYLQAEFPLVGSLPERFAFGIRSYRNVHDRLTLRLGLDVLDVLASTYRVQGEARYTLPSAHTIVAGGEAKGSLSQEPEWKATASYTFPFDLQLGRRSDVGELVGRVVDEAGQSLPDMVVQINGQRTTTGGDGRFRFAAVRAGTYHVTFRPDQLGPERITLPQTPWRVEIPAGTRVEQEFRVVEGARVDGRLRLLPPPTDTLEAGAVFGEGPGEADKRWVAGMLVELVDHEIAYRRVTDEQGRFSFEQLPPGEWRLRVHRNGLPQWYEIRPAEQAIHLRAGAEEQVEVDVVPVPRRIQLVEGGVLQPAPPVEARRPPGAQPADQPQPLTAPSQVVSATAESETPETPEARLGTDLKALFTQVRPQDTLSAIARDFGVTLEALRRANPQVTDPRRIRRGQRIRIPGLVEETYVIQPGDTLFSLARSRDVPLAGLRRVNPEIADPRQIRPGQQIIIPRHEGEPYVVRAGDSLWSIARSLGVPLETLLQMNPQIADPRLILEGETIWVPPGPR
ncbi:LysM peptidoglycan-binding domain-containing protein [Limnochorda pilosa]|uniref:LysM peptidoglycan-binding domain-containing protein n=1 Tax=Limnochorda pilosa TaxID=1555112 RepID=UPI00118737FC|nr:LysM peptidoglycan-binding domain-containing protein [Limnochorda pilosa]